MSLLCTSLVFFRVQASVLVFTLFAMPSGRESPPRRHRMIVFTVLFVVLAAAAAHAKDDPSQVIERASAEARKVAPEAKARTGRVISDEMNRSSFTELDLQPEPFRDAILRAGRSFTELWPAVNDAVQTRDPRYKPYAATLVTYASAHTSGSGGVLLFEAHVALRARRRRGCGTISRRT
jgi:hypothetical protein